MNETATAELKTTYTGELEMETKELKATIVAAKLLCSSRPSVLADYVEIDVSHASPTSNDGYRRLGRVVELDDATMHRVTVVLGERFGINIISSTDGLPAWGYVTKFDKPLWFCDNEQAIIAALLSVEGEVG